MTMLIEVLQELAGMFIADARLALSILALILLIAVLTFGVGLAPLVCGGLLVLGCILILIEAVFREARQRRSSLGRRTME